MRVQIELRGSKTADKRAALVDYFRDTATIMIATEAAAEGINLQFCSLVVNYDFPWNPQRIEQRIGRCHRYGQKFDVVVVNFLNNTNAADQRDSPQALEFQRLEMNYYWKILDIKQKKDWSEYSILWSSRSNNFGQHG